MKKLTTKKQLRERIEALEKATDLHRKAGIAGGIAAATAAATNFALIISQRNILRGNTDQIIEMIGDLNDKLDEMSDDGGRP